MTVTLTPLDAKVRTFDAAFQKEDDLSEQENKLKKLTEEGSEMDKKIKVLKESTLRLKEKLA